jgi:hypothetical protein
LDPVVKKALFILLIPMILIGLVIALPYISPHPSPLWGYPWMDQGTDTIIDMLWDPIAQKFKEMPENATAYWVDDQAKILWLMLEDPQRYQTYIDKTISNLYSVWSQGYFPRRWVIIKPEVLNNDTSNVDIQNGFLKIMGDLTGENSSNPLRVRMYEAAGGNDVVYLGGQSYIVDRKNMGYHMISYDIAHLRAEQCQNPGFDVWDPTWDNASMLRPWAFSFPDGWFYSHEPPFGCVYSTKFLYENAPPWSTGTGRCIGLEDYVTGSTKNWRSPEFTVSNSTNYTYTFQYRGQYFSGGSFKSFVRWFDSSHAFISQNYVELTSNQSSWNVSSNTWASPAAANFADVLFWAESDTSGDYYFDNVAMTSCTIPNANFEEPDRMPFSSTTFHSQSKYIGRSAQFYESFDYINQWLSVPVNVSNLYNFTFYAKSAIPTTNLNFYAFYNDSTYSQVTRAINSTDWNVYAVQAGELSANKIIVAFAMKTGTASIDTYVDDVAVHYKPTNAVKAQSVGTGIALDGTLQYAETIQTYQDDDSNFTLRYRLEKDTNYVQPFMDYRNLQNYTTDIFFTGALDGLSTITSGEGSQTTAYSSIWIPNVGRRSHTPGAYIDDLFDASEAYLWQPEHNYFITELKAIPEWSGCYGIALKVPVQNIVNIANSNADPSSPYLHYLTYTFRWQNIGAQGNKTFAPQMFCLNGYDFTNPAIYDQYFMNIDKYKTVDLSMSFHIGTILYALTYYLEKTDTDPYGMAANTWNYYKYVFSSHNNGSYLLTTGKVMEAGMMLYQKYHDPKYLDFNKVLADYLVGLQITSGIRNGTFPMKHNNASYLDCQAACLIGLKLMQAYNSTYADAYAAGINAIQYDYEPGGIGKIIDPASYGVTIPNIKRFFIYSNESYIDDDFFTFKSAYVARAAAGMNDSLAMLALSRVWRNIEWNDVNLTVYVCESIPSRSYPGTRADWINTNSETQPYGLYCWLQIARAQRSAYNYYYEFLKFHYGIESANITASTLDVVITGENNSGTISTFFLANDQGDKYVVPISIRIDGTDLNETANAQALLATNENCYYYNRENYSLIVKGFALNGSLELQITWDQRVPEMWMPIMPILGFVGFIMCCIAPIWLIQEVKKGKYLDAMAIPFILFLVGIGLIIAWLWR